MTNITNDLVIAKIDSSIQMLKKHIDDASIESIIPILEALRQTPNNESLIKQLSETLNNMGVTQGAVLTYAPYISVLLSDEPFG